MYTYTGSKIKSTFTAFFLAAFTSKKIRVFVIKKMENLETGQKLAEI